MENPLRSPRVDLIAWDRDAFYLQSDDSLTGHKKVRAWVWGETVHPKLNVLEEISQTPEGDSRFGRPWVLEMQRLIERLGRPLLKHWYRAELDGPEPFRPHLEVLLEPAPHQGVEHRRSQRFERAFRVMSQDLPDLRATVRDISDTGIGLDLIGPLERGARVTMRLDPDVGSISPFPVQAEICWCRPSVQSAPAESRTGMTTGTHRFEAGARFLALAPESHASLMRFLATLQQQDDDEHVTHGDGHMP